MTKKHYLKILIAAALIILLSFGLVKSAHAGWFDLSGIKDAALSFIISTVLYILSFIGGLLVTIAAFLVNWSLNLNSHVLTSSTVETGWRVSRDLANLGFVLAIIVISFATILRIQTYEVKKLLSRLIIAALLVNFSLVIAGIFIDFSGMLTNFFIDRATSGNPSELATQLTGKMGVHKLLEARSDAQSTLEGIKDSLKAGINFIASLFFIILFTLTGAIALLGLAFMFFIRYIALTILLILAPLAWVFWILPDFAHLSNKWWQQFFRWVWFAPAASFFIYLAFVLAKEGPNLNVGDPQNALGNNLTVNNPGEVIGQMIAIIGILIGGLITANSMGIIGADVTLKAAGKARGMVLGAPVAGAGALGRRLRDFGYQPPKIDPKTGQHIAGGSYIQRQSANLTSGKLFGIPLPGLGGAARTVNQWVATSRESQKEIFGKELTELAKNKTAFINAGKDPLRMRNDAFASQYVKVAAEKGLLKDLVGQNPEALEGGIQAARRDNTAKELYKKDPTLAKRGRNLAIPEEKEAAMKDMEEAISKMSAEDVLKLPPEAFEQNLELAANLTPKHIEELAKNKSRAQKETILRTADQWSEVIDNPETAQQKPELQAKLTEWNALSKERQTAYRKGIEDLQRLRRENLAFQVQGFEQPRIARPATLPPPRIEVTKPIGAGF